MSFTDKQCRQFPEKGLRKRVYSRISLVEIDKIKEERLSRDANYRENKRKKASGTLMVNNKNDVDFEEAYDLFSRLPDDIVCSVISRLSTREAVRTSVLSKAWKELWRRSLKKLDFDAKFMRSRKTRDFVRQVNQILACHHGNEIESFRVSRYLPKKYGAIVDDWIRFAVEKKVQKLDINLSVKSPFSYAFRKAFPFQIFRVDKGGATLKHLSLSSCLFRFPSGTFTGLRSLKSLTLKHSRVSHTDVLRILTNCSLLEWLSIARCYCGTGLKFTNESSSDLRLKHLNISCCERLEEVDIREAKNLLSFEYKGYMLNRLLCGNNGTSVKRLSFYGPYDCTDYVHNGLASDFPRLETLLLSIPSYHAAQCLPTFYNLKTLVLNLVRRHPEDLWPQISAILQASPRLDKLELHFPRYGGSNREVKLISSSDFKHDNLREVGLYNFQGQAREVELLVYLVNSATAIENIRVHKQLSRYNGNGEWLNLKRPSLKISRSQVLRKLSTRLPATINLDVF